MLASFLIACVCVRVCVCVCNVVYRWVQDFLSEENGGLKELVKYMSYRCQAEMQLP